jgi:hypothetical protein
MELDLEGVAVAFVETELERLEKELKSLHSQLPPLSSSDEIRLLSVLKAVLGEDDDASSHNGDNRSGWEMFDLVPPTLDAFARNSKWRNSLDRYTSGLLLQLKLRFFILIKDFSSSNKSQATTTRTDEGQEDEEMDGGTPTSTAAASLDEDAKSSVHVDIKDLMPPEYEQSEGQRDEFIKAKHTAAKELTESKFKLVLEQSNVSSEKEADYLQRFGRLLQRRLEKLLFPEEDEKTEQFEGTRNKRPYHLNREEEDEEEELINSHEKKLRLPKGRLDKNIQREMYRLLREYDRLMKQYLAASLLSQPSWVPPPASQTVEEDPPPPPTVSIAIHFGWNYTNVGWIPPSKSTAELLCPPIHCLIGFNGDESEILYGNQIYEALGKQLPSPKTRLGSYKYEVSSCHNLKSMLADKEVEWRKGKANVKSELPLAIFLIHVKTKIEAAIQQLSSTVTKYKVILVLPQVLSIVQRGRIYDAMKLAGFADDQVHLIKETTAAALDFAHDAAIWSPGSMLPIVLYCPQEIDSYYNASTADVAIFSNKDGIITMGESAGRQGLGLTGVRTEFPKFKKKIEPFKGELNKNSVIVHLDDGNYMHFRALHHRVIVRSAAASRDLLNKIREHLTKSTVRYLLCF